MARLDLRNLMSSIELSTSTRRTTTTTTVNLDIIYVRVSGRVNSDRFGARTRPGGQLFSINWPRGRVQRLLLLVWLDLTSRLIVVNQLAERQTHRKRK